MSVICRGCGHLPPGQYKSGSFCPKCGGRLDPVAEVGDVPSEANEGVAGFVTVIVAIAGFMIVAAVGIVVFMFVSPAKLMDELQEVAPQQAAADAPPSAAPWVDFDHLYFSAKFPKKPAHHKQIQFTLAGPLTIHHYRSRSLVDNYEYQVAFFEIPSYAELDNEKAMSGAVQEGTSDMSDFATSREMLDGRNALKITGQTKTGLQRTAYILRSENRCYAIAVEGGTDFDRKVFLASVQIRGSGSQLFTRTVEPVFWVSYDSPKDFFRCELPQRPTVEDDWRDIPATRGYVAEATEKERGRFTVFHRRLTADEAADVDSVYRQTVKVVCPEGAEVRQETVKLNAASAQQYEWQSGDQACSLRLLLRDGKLYGLLAENAPRNRVNQFYDKFAVLAEQAAATDVAEKAKQPPRPTENPVFKALASQDSRRERKALTRLKGQKPDRSQPKLTKAIEYTLLYSPNRSNRALAAEVLQTWANRDSVGSLSRALDDEWSFTGREAAVALGRLRTPPAMRMLTARLGDFHQRSTARRGLLAAGPVAVPYVGAVLRGSRDEDARRAAIDLLVEIGTPNTRSYLAAARNDRSTSVRMRAESALRRLGR